MRDLKKGRLSLSIHSLITCSAFSAFSWASPSGATIEPTEEQSPLLLLSSLSSSLSELDWLSISSILIFSEFSSVWIKLWPILRQQWRFLPFSVLTQCSKFCSVPLRTISLLEATLKPSVSLVLLMLMLKSSLSTTFSLGLDLVITQLTFSRCCCSMKLLISPTMAGMRFKALCSFFFQSRRSLSRMDRDSAPLERRPRQELSMPMSCGSSWYFSQQQKILFIMILTTLQIIPLTDSRVSRWLLAGYFSQRQVLSFETSGVSRYFLTDSSSTQEVRKALKSSWLKRERFCRLRYLVHLRFTFVQSSRLLPTLARISFCRLMQSRTAASSLTVTLCKLKAICTNLRKVRLSSGLSSSRQLQRILCSAPTSYLSEGLMLLLHSFIRKCSRCRQPSVTTAQAMSVQRCRLLSKWRRTQQQGFSTIRSLLTGE